MASDIGLGTLLRLLIARLDDAVQLIYDERGTPFRPRFYPLVARLRDGAASVTDLARAARVSQPAATQTLGELARLDLIVLAPGKDRRARIARLTPAGERLVDELEPVWRAVGRAAEALEPGLANLIAQVLAALDAEPFAVRIRKEIGSD